MRNDDRETEPRKCKFLAWDYPQALAATFLASLVFLCLPGFSSLLYVIKRLSNPTGVSSNEWIWTFATSLWIASLFRLGSSNCNCNAKPLHRFRVLVREQTAWWIFVAANVVWMVLPLVSYYVSYCVSYYQRLPEDANATERMSWNDKDYWIKWIDLIGGKSAWPALWNVAFVCIPIQRVSPLLESMGISSQQAVEGHIWAANAALAWLLVHAVLLSLVYAHNTNGWKEWLSLMVPYKMYYTEGVVNFMGWVGLVCFVGLWGFSRPLIRQTFYEAFKVLHWIFVAFFLLGSNLHDYNTFFFVQPSVVLMVVDFLARKHSWLYAYASSAASGESAAATTTDARTTVITLEASGTLCELKLPIPDTWSPCMMTNENENEPGLHVYLTVPAIARWQSHAYSISTINPKEGTFSIHCKALGSWSEALVDLDREENDPLALGIEGPYASPALHATVLRARHCVFLAGGVGITGVASLARARCRHLLGEHDDSSSDATTTSLLWMVQTRSEARCLLPLLRDDATGNPVPGNLCTHVWITRDDRSTPPQSLSSGSRSDSNSNDYASLDHTEKGGRRGLEHGLPYNNNNNNSNNTTITSIKTIKVRWDGAGNHHQWHTGSVLVATLLSSAITMVLSRWICTMQPVEDLEDLPYRLKECRILWHSSKCRSCDIEDTFDLEEDYPCCTTPVCQYCFRGIPMVLMYLGTPLLAIGLARLFRGFWLRSCAGRWGYSSVGYDDDDESVENEVEVVPTTHHHEGGLRDRDAASTNNRGIAAERSPSPPLSSSSTTIGFHHGARPSSTEELFGDRYLPFGTTSDAASPRNDVLVVLCGPPKLLEVTRKDLANDPLRKHWRVVLAS